MSSNKESRNLLDELETLKQVLDDAAGEKIDLERALTQLNTVDEIPVLSDLLSEESTAGVSPLKAVSGPQTGVKANGNIATLRPVTDTGNHPLDLRPQPRPLSPSEALNALHKQIDALPDEQRSGEDWFDGTGNATSSNTPLSSEPMLLKDSLLDDVLQDAVADSDAEPLTLDDILDAGDEPLTRSSQDTDSAATPGENAISDKDADREPASSQPQAKPAASAQTESKHPNADPQADHKAAPPQTANPFLPQAVLDRLTRERLAAQHSAEEAHRTMQRVNQRMDQKNAEAAASLTDHARDKLIEEMIQEMIPHIQARLRERLRQMLKPQHDQEDEPNN